MQNNCNFGEKNSLWMNLFSTVFSFTAGEWAGKDLHPYNELGDNCIQNFHLGIYIVGYTVGNLVLRSSSTAELYRKANLPI